MQTDRIERMHGRIRWDIVDMGQRLAYELKNHMLATEEAEHEICYMIAMKGSSSRARWGGKNGNPRIFTGGSRFANRELAEEYAKRYELPDEDIVCIDLVISETVKDSIYAISDAAEFYSENKMCPICQKNAATRILLRRTSEALAPCRLCDDDVHKQPDVTDFLIGDSPLAEAQELEPAPSFTREEMDAVSRAAAKRRIFPQFRPEGL